MRKPPIETLFFYAALCIGLLPVLCCDYIVTTDGPCHFYNSNILLSWLEGKSGFYKPFLQLNQYIEPNWLTNAIQVPLLKILPVIWVEKFFFAAYLFVFAFGFRNVILQINPQSVFLSVIGVLFAWNYVLQKGFTNNAWSFAIWFWILVAWMKVMEKPSWTRYGMISFLLILIYLAHPIGLFFACLSIVCVVLFKGLYSCKDWGIKKTMVYYITEAGKLLACSLIPLIFLSVFFLRREWSAETTSSSFRDVGRDLIYLRALNTLSFDEEILLLILAGLILFLFLLAVYTRIQNKRVLSTDGMLLLFIASLIVIFNPPGSLSGGLDVGARLGIVPFICLLFWMATTEFNVNVKHAVSALAVLIAGGLMWIRLPIHINASAYASEVVSCKDSIRDQSTLLALNYDWVGKDLEGKDISDRMWLFLHIDCYLGTYKDLVISDNYEANFWYFPLVERWETNMYTQTDKDGINFDHRPPRADMKSFNRRTGGQNIDYVLLLSYRDEFADHPYTKEIFQQLDEMYQKVFTSEHSRAILYRRITL
jgi:hypothetical protein